MIWPDGKSEKWENVKADQVLTLKYDAAKATRYNFKSRSSKQPKLFKESSRALKLVFKHQEQDKIDFNLQRTLPHKFSQSGPSMAVGDVNNDHRDDLIIGGSSGHPMTVFTQQPTGTFLRSQ